jgi:hypothetical protein
VWSSSIHDLSKRPAVNKDTLQLTSKGSRGSKKQDTGIRSSSRRKCPATVFTALSQSVPCRSTPTFTKGQNVLEVQLWLTLHSVCFVVSITSMGMPLYKTASNLCRRLLFPGTKSNLVILQEVFCGGGLQKAVLHHICSSINNQEYTHYTTTPAYLMLLHVSALRRISRHKNDGVTGEWRRLHNKELCLLCSSSNNTRVMKLRRHMGTACSTDGKRRGAHRVLV